MVVLVPHPSVWLERKFFSYQLPHKFAAVSKVYDLITCKLKVQVVSLGS